MTKKKKIIIIAVCVSLAVISVITGIILATMKRFDITPNETTDFNNHTEIIEVSRGTYQKVGTSNVLYNNGTQIIQDSNGNQGLFSYIENKLVLDAKYLTVTNIVQNTEDGRSLFKVYSKESTNCFKIADDKGNMLSLTETDEANNKTYAYIKTKSIELDDKNENVKVKIDNSYEDKKVEIKSISYDSTYYVKDKCTYELWNITTSDSIVYKNLYKVEDNDRELIQTLNNSIGNSSEISNVSVYITTDGNPLFISQKSVTYNANTIATETTVYDAKFNKKGTIQIDSSITNNQTAYFSVGDSAFIQCLQSATEKDYDFIDNQNLLSQDTLYYKLNTYKINYAQASLSQVDFDYLVTNQSSIFNLETALINAYKIENKSLTNNQNILINERLQTKELSYEFNTITKIKDDRYIASIDGTSNFNLIDGSYNLISSLENYNSVFTTKDAIIISDSSNYVYICNMDGIIIDKSTVSHISNINDERYYLKKVDKVVNSENVTEYYIEQLGLTNENPIHSYVQGSSTYTYNDTTYVNFQMFTNDYISIIIRVKEQSNSMFTYEFYNFENELLFEVKDIATNYNTCTLVESYGEYTDYALFNFYGHTYRIDR